MSLGTRRRGSKSNQNSYDGRNEHHLTNDRSRTSSSTQFGGCRRVRTGSPPLIHGSRPVSSDLASNICAHRLTMKTRGKPTTKAMTLAVKNARREIESSNRTTTTAIPQIGRTDRLVATVALLRRPLQGSLTISLFAFEFVIRLLARCIENWDHNACRMRTGNRRQDFRSSLRRRSLGSHASSTVTGTIRSRTTESCGLPHAGFSPHKLR